MNETENYLFDKIKDLEAGTTPDSASLVELAGETRFGGLELDNRVCFGYKIVGTTATLYAGEAHHATAAVDEVAGTSFDFDGLALVNDDYYTFVEYTMGAGAVWASPNATRPVSDTTIYRVWFYIFTWASPSLTLKTTGGIGHFGNIELPSTFED